jgi:hypothetical protein
VTGGGEILCGEQKTGQTCLPDFLSVDRVELKELIGVRSIISLESGRLDGATRAYVVEPPYTERYVRWCERTAIQLMNGLLLD